MDIVMGVVFGAIIGLALGLLGGGGSILTVPVLVYLLGQDGTTAVVTSLIIVGTNAAVGSVMHWRAGHVKWREALLFGAASMTMAYIAASIANALNLPDPVLLTAFAVLMLVVAGLMLRPTKPDSRSPLAELTGWRKVGVTLLAGGMVGILTGFLGVGGGFLIVPALAMVLGFSMADAVGTSLLLIVASSIAGLAGYLPLVGIDWGLIAVFVLAGLGGLALGTYWSSIWSPRRLRTAFAMMVVGLGVTLLVLNVPPLLGLVGGTA